MKVLAIITLAIWILALVADLVVCLQKHKNNKADYAFYKKSMYFVGFVSGVCGAVTLYGSVPGSTSMCLFFGALMYFIAMFYHWFKWSTIAKLYKRQP